MKRKLTDVSTIMILNKNQQGTKTLQIKTKHISRFKHYIAGALLLVLSLTTIVFYLSRKSQQQEAEKVALLAQINKLKGNVSAASVSARQTKSAQSYIQAIEAKLQTINNYLRKRGLPGFSTKQVGGDINADAKLSDKEKYTLYDEYLGNLVKTVAFTPMGYPRVSSFNSIFGYRSDPFNSASAEFHPGIDFQGKKGDAVKCTANGKIVYAGWANGYGNCIRIAHGNDLETVYGHLSHIDVKVGQQVNVGDVIGEVGSTGHSTGAHLHYEVRKNGKPVNPVKFLTLNN